MLLVSKRLRSWSLDPNGFNHLMTFLKLAWFIRSVFSKWQSVECSNKIISNGEADWRAKMWLFYIEQDVRRTRQPISTSQRDKRRVLGKADALCYLNKLVDQLSEFTQSSFCSKTLKNLMNYFATTKLFKIPNNYPGKFAWEMIYGNNYLNWHPSALRRFAISGLCWILS